MNAKDFGKIGGRECHYYKKPIIENSTRVNVSSFVREVLLGLRKAKGGKESNIVNLSKEKDVREFVRFSNSRPNVLTAEINNPKNRGEDQTLAITYTPSNLGKGFVFWFICNRCGRKARDLYATHYCHTILCRKCHRLSFKSQGSSRDKEEDRNTNITTLLASIIKTFSDFRLVA